MFKLLSSNEIIKILQRHGFVFISQKGSHKKFHKAEKTVIVPAQKKEIPAGTLFSIIRQSGLSKKDFIK